MFFTEPENAVRSDMDPMQPKIKIAIFGVGGGGCNAINRLVASPGDFKGVKFIAANTDAMALSQVKDEGVEKIYLGRRTTEGMGAGSNPEIGKHAANESKEEITNAIRGMNLLFVTAGMGGGTGTGAAPVVASIAQELKILTIGVVTKPFRFEGTKKMQVAENGIDDLRRYVDVLVVIPNEKAFMLSNNKEDAMVEVFRMADNVLKQSILGVVNIVGRHSVINTDFADIRTVIEKKGMVHIGIGHASGENRVMDALRQACKNPLMDTSVKGAHNVIIDISTDGTVSADRISEAYNMIPEIVAKDANIITGFGFTGDKDEVTVTIIATGFEDDISKEMNDQKRTKAKAEEELLNEFGLNKFPDEEQVKKTEEPKDNIPAFLRFMRNSSKEGK